ncbi:hypothetical protein HDE_13182 [Halotydeus destructor]|nr:hypothetical protein HDE_13182 [Halotydeus destructor]
MDRGRSEKTRELQRQLEDLNDQKHHLVETLEKVERNKTKLEQQLQSQGDYYDISLETGFTEKEMVVLLNQKAEEMEFFAQNLQKTNGEMDKKINCLMTDLTKKIDNQAQLIDFYSNDFSDKPEAMLKNGEHSEYFNALSELSLAD